MKEHDAEYDMARPSMAGVPFFSTTKAHLDEVWGPRKALYYMGSDEKYHYIMAVYEKFNKRLYFYTIPAEVKIQNELVKFEMSTEYSKYKKTIFIQ